MIERDWNLRTSNVNGMTIPFDGVLLPDIREFIDGSGQRLTNIHDPSACEGRWCVIHNQSEHEMRGFVLQARVPGPFDIKPLHMERICEHGIGHPDPDDEMYWAAQNVNVSVHGCDGCCHA